MRGLDVLMLVCACLLHTVRSPVTVYNFQVEDYHTYYVADNGLPVHNNRKTDKATAGLGYKKSQARDFMGNRFKQTVRHPAIYALSRLILVTTMADVGRPHEQFLTLR